MMRMAMKMAAAASTITLLLLCCSVIASTDSQDACDHYAATGDSFTVPLHHTLDSSHKLKWMHNDATIFNRMAQTVVIGSKDDVYENGSLKLTNLEKSSAGKYTPEVFNENGQAIKDLKSVELCILDRVQKPTVKIACPSTSVKFICSVAQDKGLKFEWLQNNNVLEKEKGPTLTQTASQVVTDSFSCRVSNQISSKTSDPVKQSCFTPKPFFPKELFGINTWIFVGGGGGVVLVLIIVVIVCCIRTKRRKCMQLKEEGELRLAWTNPDQQQHQHQHNHPPDHHHHHHQQQQPAGHTGPRQHRSKQHREQQRPRAPDHANSHPQPSPRRPAQGPRPVDDEQPPPLPQPRKKAPKTPRV